MTYNSIGRPLVTSYDSGYEHSLEHLIETRHLVEEADENSDPSVAAVAAASGRRGSVAESSYAVAARAS